MIKRECFATDFLACVALILDALMFLGSTVQAQGLGCSHEMDEETTNASLQTRGFSPYAGRTYPTQVYWGDQHVHTGWSVDAGGIGATLDPEEALRFALG